MIQVLQSLNVNQMSAGVVSEAESRAKKQANSSEYGLLDAADANATNIVRGLFENVADGREVVVEFKQMNSGKVIVLMEA